MDLRSEMIRDIRIKYNFGDEVVLSALEKIPRHRFTKVKISEAYSDNPIPIGRGQTMSQPYTVAYMTHLLIENQKGVDNWKVLEIGAGSGYQAAVLSILVKEVFTVELIPELAEKAKKTLNILGYNNVHVKKGSGVNGWKEHIPYDAIMITAALEDKIPSKLISQLKIGGRIVAPVGPWNLQTMTRFSKEKSGKVEKEAFDKFVFVPFIKEKSSA